MQIQEIKADLSKWSLSGKLPSSVISGKAFVTKDAKGHAQRVYLLGGRSNGALNDTCFYTQVKPDGSLGSWLTSEPIPMHLQTPQVCVTKEAVYLIGGWASQGCSSKVFRSVIDAQGVLGAWVELQSTPFQARGSACIVVKNSIYILGGEINDKASDEVFTCHVQSDGSLSSWQTLRRLPKKVHSPEVFVTTSKLTGKSVLNVLGRCPVNSDVSLMYAAEVNLDGSVDAWQIGQSLPVGLSSFELKLDHADECVFVMGGIANGTDMSSVYTCNIKEDGMCGAWCRLADLQTTLFNAHSVSIGDKIHLLGGFANCKPSEYIFKAVMTKSMVDVKTLETSVKKIIKPKSRLKYKSKV